MIRVLLKHPLADEQIPSEVCSTNSVLFDGMERAAIYLHSLPIPTSIPQDDILEVYDTNA